jgi:hypothetical protein
VMEFGKFIVTSGGERVIYGHTRGVSIHKNYRQILPQSSNANEIGGQC